MHNDPLYRGFLKEIGQTAAELGPLYSIWLGPSQQRQSAPDLEVVGNHF